MSENAFLFSSSFLTASDSKGTPQERLARFKEANGIEALRTYAAEVFGVKPENVYDEAIRDAAEKVKSAVPDFSVFSPLLLKYDCTNIKTAIKCAIRNIPADSLLFSCGTIDTGLIVDAALSSQFSKIPGEMGKAAGEAMTEYRKTGEVRAIDLALDRACFADMTKAADDGGVGLIRDIVTFRADGTNLLSSMRISSSGMPDDVAAALFMRAFVPGGSASLSSFISNTDKTLMSADETVIRTKGDSREMMRKAADSDSFAAAEKVIDDSILKLCDKYRYVPFGPETAVRFILIRETEIMNCRIIESAMNAPGKEEILAERLRVAYV